MYFGSTGPAGLTAVLLEVVSNSFDQVLSHAVDRIAVSIHNDGSAVVKDNGPGRLSSSLPTSRWRDLGRLAPVQLTPGRQAGAGDEPAARDE
jgi:DNA gyrase/topoisomerase IV subunit B